MKKIIILIISVIVFLSILFIVIELPKYRFGYFTKIKKTRLNYGNKIKNVYKSFSLDNGNILFLGANIIYKTTNKNETETLHIPSILYNTKTNKLTEINFPKDIYYASEGILLKNNKFLLTNVANPNNDKKYDYSSMAIVDLENFKVEKVLLNEKLTPQNHPPIIALLGNNKIFQINSTENKNEDIVKIYNLENNSSKLIHFKKLNFTVSQAIPVNNEKILLFGESKLSEDELKTKKYGGLDDVYEYDNSKETIKQVGKVLRRNNCKRIKLDNKILIIGGEIKLSTGNYLKSKAIENYDINTNKSEIVANTILSRCAGDSLNGAKFGGKYFLILGGRCEQIPIYSQYAKTKGNPSKQSEILDLEDYKIYLGPKTKYPVSGQEMIPVNDNTILITKSRNTGYTNDIQIFKMWKWRKYGK